MSERKLNWSLSSWRIKPHNSVGRSVAMVIFTWCACIIQGDNYPLRMHACMQLRLHSSREREEECPHLATCFSPR